MKKEERNMDELMNLKFDSELWKSIDDYYTARHFTEIGFTNVKEILDLRVYDFLNMNRIDNNRAEEMLVCLYNLFNSTPEIDEWLYYDEIEQPFDLKKWFSEHRNLAEVKVNDIVLAEDINKEAMYKIFDRITRSFYKSDEYDLWAYRYGNYSEYKRIQGRNKKNKEHV